MTDRPDDPDPGSNSEAAIGSTPPPPPPATDGARRPTWLVPAVVGLVIGLVVAVVAVVVTRDDSDTLATPPAPGEGATTIETVEPDPTTVAATDPPSATPATPAPTDPTATEPAPTNPPATDPTATDPTATEPAATDPTAVEPAPTDPPPTTLGPVEPADDGFVRIGPTQYKIDRTCVTSPFAPASTGYVVFSYLFLDANGVPQIADHWFADDGVTGGSYSDGGTAVDAGYTFLGADEFALTLRRDEATTRVVVNPPADGAVECAGQILTNDIGTPTLTYTRSIVDVCFGSEAGPLQYVGYASEGGRFTAAPNADGTVTLRYVEPFHDGFADPAASAADIDGGTEVRGTATSDGLTGPATKEIVVRIRDDAVRDCGIVDVPFAG